MGLKFKRALQTESYTVYVFVWGDVCTTLGSSDKNAQFVETTEGTLSLKSGHWHTGFCVLHALSLLLMWRPSALTLSLLSVYL